MVQAFATVICGSMGVMGRLMIEQLHFDGDPGIAAGGAGYGKLGPFDTHRFVLPGTCQLVQFGSTKVVEPAGALHRKLSTSMVTPSAPAPKTGLWSVLLVSPQLSGEGSSS